MEFPRKFIISDVIAIHNLGLLTARCSNLYLESEWFGFGLLFCAPEFFNEILNDYSWLCYAYCIIGVC